MRRTDLILYLSRHLIIHQKFCSSKPGYLPLVRPVVLFCFELADCWLFIRKDPTIEDRIMRLELMAGATGMPTTGLGVGFFF